MFVLALGEQDGDGDAAGGPADRDVVAARDASIGAAIWCRSCRCLSSAPWPGSARPGSNTPGLAPRVRPSVCRSSNDACSPAVPHGSTPCKIVWPFGLVFSYPTWSIDQAVWWQYLFPARAGRRARVAVDDSRPDARAARGRAVLSVARWRRRLASSTCFRSSIRTSPIIFSTWPAWARSC